MQGIYRALFLFWFREFVIVLKYISGYYLQ